MESSVVAHTAEDCPAQTVHPPFTDPFLWRRQLAEKIFINLYRQNSGFTTSQIAACAYDAADDFIAEIVRRESAMRSNRQ